MTTLTENNHDWAFVLSEANGHRSRENGTVASGQGKLEAGTVMAGTASAMTVWDGGTALGVLGNAVDATSEAKDAAYIARDAEVNYRVLTYTGGSPTLTQAEVTAALASLNIIVRD